MNAGGDWRPGASRAQLEVRAALLARTRGFFAARGVLEVDTPLIVNAPVSDVHIHSARVELGADAAGAARKYFLHTSPEYAMKRLLAAGSGDIYQICHVARGFECGRVHNPEFTLIEWYRTGFSLGQLMDEVEGLVRLLVGTRAGERAAERLSYREVFVRELGLDPFTAPLPELTRAATAEGFASAAGAARDELLELLMGSVIGPRLGAASLTFIHGYPASQAALARLDPADARTAERFELYGGVSSSPTASASLPRPASSARASRRTTPSGGGAGCRCMPWMSACWQPSAAACPTARASRSASTAP